MKAHNLSSLALRSHVPIRPGWHMAAQTPHWSTIISRPLQLRSGTCVWSDDLLSRGCFLRDGPPAGTLGTWSWAFRAGQRRTSLRFKANGQKLLLQSSTFLQPRLHWAMRDNKICRAGRPVSCSLLFLDKLQTLSVHKLNDFLHLTHGL